MKTILPNLIDVRCEVLMQIREKDFQVIMLLMTELWWYQAMRTNLMPGERPSNYTGSSTSCLETGTRGTSSTSDQTQSSCRPERNQTLPTTILYPTVQVSKLLAPAWDLTPFFRARGQRTKILCRGLVGPFTHRLRLSTSRYLKEFGIFLFSVSILFTFAGRLRIIQGQSRLV